MPHCRWGSGEFWVECYVAGLPITCCSIDVMASSCTALADQCIVDFQVNHNNLQAALAKNPVLVTALNPLIGYLRAAEIAKRAYSEQRDILDVAEEMTTYSREELLGYLDPERLTRGGLHA